VNTGKSAVARFYQESGYHAGPDGFYIKLDGRPVKTPSGADMTLPSEPLAGEVAAEWQAQTDQIMPDSMPLTGLSCTAIDKVRPERANLIAQMGKYGEHDLLCYRADQPTDLRSRQDATWQPLLDWASRIYQVKLVVTNGIVHVPQPSHSVENFSRAIDRYSDFELTALVEITQLTGSAVLGMAVCAGFIKSHDAFVASQLDEIWQNERWGEDHENTIRRQNILADLNSATQFLDLVRG